MKIYEVMMPLGIQQWISVGAAILIRAVIIFYMFKRGLK